jgi:hypothetical protein
MRPKYPQAIATPAPAALLRHASGTVPALAAVQKPTPAEPPVLRQISAAEGSALTDTQVLQILEKRRVDADGDAGQKPDRPEISVLRPEDTQVRRLLKEAVIQGAPVLFVVQLRQGGQPIDLKSVPTLDIFRAYKLYTVESRREGNPWYALRLGFFKDAGSAKQVAYYVREGYASAAVMPIDEQESIRAKQGSIVVSHPADPLQKSIDEMLAADQAAPAPAERPTSSATTARLADTSTSKSSLSPKPAATARKDRPKDSLEQTLELLATSELWGNSDSLEETGVRHLKVEVQQKRRPGRA